MNGCTPFFHSFEPSRSTAIVAIALERDLSCANQKYKKFIDSIETASELQPIPVERHLYKVVCCRKLISCLTKQFVFNDPQNLERLQKLSLYKYVVLPKFRNPSPLLYPSSNEAEEQSTQTSELFERERMKIYNILQRIHGFSFLQREDPLLETASSTHAKSIRNFRKMEFFHHSATEGPFFEFNDPHCKPFFLWSVSAFNISSTNVIAAAVKSIFGPTKFYLLEQEHQRLEKLDQIVKGIMPAFAQHVKLISDYLFADEDLAEYYLALSQPEAIPFSAFTHESISTKLREYENMALTVESQLNAFGKTKQRVGGILYQYKQILIDFRTRIINFRYIMLNYHFKENISESEYEEESEIIEALSDSFMEDFHVSKIPEKNTLQYNQILALCIELAKREIAENIPKFRDLLLEGKSCWKKLEAYFVSKKLSLDQFIFDDIFSHGNSKLDNIDRQKIDSENYFLIPTELNSAIFHFSRILRVLQVALIALNYVIFWENEKSDISVLAANKLRTDLFIMLKNVKHRFFIDEHQFLSSLENSFDVACSIYKEVTAPAPATPTKAIAPVKSKAVTPKPKNGTRTLSAPVRVLSASASLPNIRKNNTSSIKY